MQIVGEQWFKDSRKCDPNKPSKKKKRTKTARQKLRDERKSIKAKLKTTTNQVEIERLSKRLETIDAKHYHGAKGQQKANQVINSNYKPPVESDLFLESYDWRQLRYKVLTHYGSKCMCCGRTPKDGSVMNVDHIKPRKLFPQLALDFNNLQILCHDCNHGKGNWDQTDHR
jgi:5-methylcytosine-specific restriction endonuclease McrA